MKIIARFLAVLLLLAVLPVRGQNVPGLMAYQGFLADTNAVALGNTNAGPKTFNLAFCFWNNPTNGSVVYAEQQPVTVTKGMFSVLLGQGGAYSNYNNANFAAIFSTTNATNATLYVRTTLLLGATQYTVCPRLRLLSSPYVFQAQYAAGAGTANYANALGGNSNSLVVNLTNNTVNVGGPLTINGALTAAGLSVGSGPATNVVLTINGAAGLNSANVSGNLAANQLQAGNLFLNGGGFATNLSLSSLTVTGSLSAGLLVVTNMVTVTNSLTTTNFLVGTLAATNISASTITASTLNLGSLQVTNTVAGGAPSFAGDLMFNNGTGHPLLAVGGIQALRIIQGSVSSAGLVTWGTNFTVSKASNTSHGTYYNVAFSQPFSGTPVVFPTSENLGTGEIYMPVLTTTVNTGFQVFFMNKGETAYAQDFQFIAIGPP